MNLNSKSVITLVASGRRVRQTRIGSKHYNRALRDGKLSHVLNVESSSPIVLSKGLSWVDCGLAIRAGKSVQARVEVPAKAREKKSV
jgi:uncharacterized membrane protein